MSKKLNDFFDKQNLNGRIGHAYLIANTDLDHIFKDLEEVLSKYFFCNDIEICNHQDVFVLKPIDEIIKKNQIQELKFFLNKTSQFTGKKVYIIDHAELLNASSSNSLLKVLEEPEEDIFAFLITTNINGVLKTIKSRCQLIFLSSEDNNILIDLNDEIFKEALNIVKTLELSSVNCFPYAYQLFLRKNDKQHLKDLLENMLKIYEQCLKSNLLIDNTNLENEKIDQISKLISNDNIIKKIIILNKYLNYLNYNLNCSLFVDKLLIDLGGMK